MSCIDTRPAEDSATRRRYACACGARVSTLETVIAIKGQPPIVSKEYERGLADGMEKMLRKVRAFAEQN